MRSVSEREKSINGGRRRPPRVSVGGMSSFEASGAALLARRRGYCDFVQADPSLYS